MSTKEEMKDGPLSAKLRGWNVHNGRQRKACLGCAHRSWEEVVVDKGIESFIIYILCFFKEKQNPVIFLIKD